MAAYLGSLESYSQEFRHKHKISVDKQMFKGVWKHFRWDGVCPHKVEELPVSMVVSAYL